MNNKPKKKSILKDKIAHKTDVAVDGAKRRENEQEDLKTDQIC